MGCAPTLAPAQEWSLVKTITQNENITAQSIDPEGRLYIGTSNGNLYRYDQDGSESEFYSSQGNFPVTQVSAWNRFKVFLFFRDPQQFLFLDRFNTTPISYELAGYQAELVTLCTPGTDNSVWTLSAGYHELRKYNTQNKQPITTTPLQADLHTATYMRAYQNLLIISDPRTGLYFFDQYGNLLVKSPWLGVDYFQIWGNQLIFLEGSEIILMDAFAPGKVQKIKAPQGGFLRVLKSEDRFYFIKENTVYIYRWGS